MRSSFLLVLACSLILSCNRKLAVLADSIGNSQRGALSLSQFGCGSCHTIPGIPGAHGKVGPSLAGFGTHSYVAGVLSNQPENLKHWIEHPQSVHPLTVMPELGVPTADAADMAAYLYTLN